MRRIFNVAVSLTKNDYAEFELRPPINMVSGDHGTNILKFTVYDKGLPVDLSGNIAKITCKTPSGSRQQQDMTISSPKEGKMEVILDQRFFTEGGTYLAEVQLYDPANLKVRATLPRFTYDVDTSLLEEHRVVANEQFSILQQMVDTVASAEERSVEALDTATRAMNIATQKGDKATEEANRAKNEADRAKNEADRAWAADFAKHVTLDSETQQNFNFIKNQVVQDGLVGSELIANLPPQTYLFSTIMRLNFPVGQVSTNILKVTNNARGIASSGTSSSTFSVKYNGYITFITLNTQQYYYMYVVFNVKTRMSKNIIFDANGTIIKVTDWTEYSDVETPTNQVIANSSFISKLLTYNRELTPKEIQHNLSVLNNSPSIKELHTTDSTGKTSILKLGSDEDHVEMASGRTLREEYMGVLKTMGKEVPSADGSPIEVNNGIPARAINAEIKGQTIKNVFDFDVVQHTSEKIVVYNTLVMNHNGYSLKNMTNKPLFVQFYELDGVTWKRNGTLASGGVAKVVNDEFIRIVNGLFADGWTINDKELLASTCVIVPTGDIGKVTSYIPFGLNSTQAIISNNSQQYPIYEPTIQGKTRILKAPKGTQNWVEISDSEARDTVTYDYKLDSVNGDLGSIPNVSDYVDRARKVKVMNTKEVELDGSENWRHVSKYGTAFRYDLENVLGVKPNSNAICSRYNKITISTADVEGIGIHLNSDILQIQSFKPTLPEFKTYLKQQKANGTPVTIRYQLATPQEVPLSEEELKAYDAHKKLISLGGVGGVYDTLEIKEDGSAILSSNFIRRVLEPSIFGTVVIEAAPNQVNTTYFRIKGINDGMKSGSQITTISDKLDSCGSNFLWENDIEGISFSDDFRIRVLKTKLPTDDSQGLIDYLTQLNATIIYQAKTPATTHIPKEITPTILTHNQTNILDVGSAVKAQSFKVTVPVDQIATINAELEAIKAVLNSPSNLLLSAKYVEDEFNKNNKLESEMMN